MSKPTWQDVPIVFVQIPRCPFCGSIRRRTMKSQTGSGDGSIARRTVCRDCGRRYVLVLEEPDGPPPGIGSVEGASAYDAVTLTKCAHSRI